MRENNNHLVIVTKVTQINVLSTTTEGLLCPMTHARYFTPSTSKPHTSPQGRNHISIYKRGKSAKRQTDYTQDHAARRRHVKLFMSENM